jgi:PAS domain S-box-containing protein
VPTDIPLVPTVRERLFRPTRWRLWIQFALLGAFVLVVPVLFASQRLLDSGREVLIEHEVIDLSDESNLRVNEFREDMAYLARDVRKLVQDNAGQPPQVAEAVLAGLNLPTSGVRADPDSINQARFRYLYGAAVGVFVFRPGEGGVKVSAATAPLPADADRRAVLFSCLADVGERLARKSPFNRSALHYQPADGGRPGRAILALAEKSGDEVVALVLDFSRYVVNRQRVSPRHFYVVTDPNGRVLIHPDPAVPDARPAIRSLVNWEYPTFGGHDWFETAALSADERKKRMARVVQNGGARLKAVEAASLAYRYRKGYLPDGELADRWAADEAAAAARRLNERMAVELDADPRLRVGEAAPTSGYVEVAHPDPARLAAVCDHIDGWWRAETGEAKARLRWTDPLDCRTFQGQLTPLRVDLNDEDDPAWLVVAASVEELREDIDHRFGRIFVRWVLPTLGIACLVGIVIVMTLTHSVNRLAVAAAKLDTDDPKPLPLHGPYEVSKLAHTLDRLVRDIQERDRQLRDRAARYETILRAAGEGVIITDAGGVIEEANKAAGRMFGYAPEALIGLPVTTLVQHPDQMPTATDSERAAGQLVSRTLDTIQGRRRDGTAFWLELNLKPTPLRDRVVVTCIFRDVSLRKEAEERVRRMNDELETRVRQRTAELEEANTKLEVAVKEAEAAAAAKDTFVANMSHELRQPLHIIIGFTEALKEEAADLNAGGIVPDLNKILAAARHLLELINDILDLAKISSGRMELAVTPFPLPKLVDDVRSLVGPLAEKNANAFAVDAPPDLGVMTADERRVRQMLLNLLSNAFKFTTGGSVTLRVRRVSEHGREWVRFTVSDTGKGMTAEQVKRLFQRFYQADSSTTRGAGGTGLGLAITQSFAVLMGGQPIRVTSQEGVGSEFEVTLPAAVDQAAKPVISPAEPPKPTPPAIPPEGIQPADGRTVLVIDDDPMVRELMERFLVKEGFRVVQAATGEDGLRLAADVRPCVVTLDVMMPGGVDGWAALARLKENPATADIPVVMLTIVDDSGRGFALGAADYLTKPIDWQRLGVILRKYLTPGRGDAVLVVDDDAHSREVVCRHLEREGWGVVEAADGGQGLAAFAADRPGLVLLDLMMPVLDGFGFLDELGKRFPRHRVPVVVLTAKELTPEDFDRLNGRVARILAKGDLSRMDELMTLIRRTAKR